jgi:hypothetical protein
MPHDVQGAEGRKKSSSSHHNVSSKINNKTTRGGGGDGGQLFTQFRFSRVGVGVLEPNPSEG